MRIEFLQDLEELLKLAGIAYTCCDWPDDRMYRAADKTWWKRVGNEWKQAEPPAGWKLEVKPGEPK